MENTKAVRIQCQRMCQMSASQSCQDPVTSDKGAFRRWLIRVTVGKSAEATPIKLGITLAAAESSDAIPGLCSRCRTDRDPQRSTSRYPNVFCSEQCEQEFIRIALVSVTLEDCIRMQRRLENLFPHDHEPAF
jgi:hypothetical protein